MQTASTHRASTKRKLILDAAQACFLEHGYAATSMDSVAGQAGVSKATIYAHFESKDRLFGAIIQRRCEDLSQGVSGAAVVDDGGDARAALTALASYLMSLFLALEVMGIYRVVVAESVRHPDLAQAYYEAGPLRGKRLLADALEAMSARGWLSAPDAWRAADLFVSMLRGECFHRALLGLPPCDLSTPEATVAAAVEAMLRTFAPISSPQ